MGGIGIGSKIPRGWDYNSVSGKYEYRVFNASGALRTVYNEDGLLFNGGAAVMQAYGDIVYVDSVNGASTNGGTCWADAFDTLQAGINKARYLSGTTTIDDTKDHRAIVLVAPGHYNEGEILFSGYNISIIGMSIPVPGKDYGVSINYDGAADATAALAFSGSGIHLANLHIYCDFAAPALFIAGGDNNLIENCVIECDGTNCTYGIMANSMKGSWIRNCVIISPKTAGVYCAGGADHYTINGGIVDCQIYSGVAGCKGIYIENTMTAYNFRVEHNLIDLEPGGATCKGIDNDATGNVFIIDNYIVVETAATAIESASHGSLHNHVSTNGTVTDPADDD